MIAFTRVTRRGCSVAIPIVRPGYDEVTEAIVRSDDRRRMNAAAPAVQSALLDHA
jgi:hypothetical protein